MKYVALWAMATAVAVSVSWFGVRDVLRQEFADVVIEPVAARTAAGRAALPTPTSTRVPTRDPVTSRPTRKPSPKPSPKQTPRRTPKQSPKPSPTPSPQATEQATEQATQQGGDVRVVTAKGGEVTFTIGQTGCRLVSATPAGGYTANVTETDAWIRVDLTQGDHGSAVFCISGERRTDVWEY
jgi:outer membrane biosynthesis protein TonB